MERDEEALVLKPVIVWFGRGRARVCRVSHKYQSSFDNDDGENRVGLNALIRNINRPHEKSV